MDYYKLLNKNVIKITEVLSKGRLYFNQIFESTGIRSKNNLLKNLNLMVQMKTLKKEKNKSNTFYSINYENQLSLVLLQLINVSKLQRLPFNRRKAIFEIVLNTRPEVAILFGSTAKGNFKEESDIDMLLVYNVKPKDSDNKIKQIASRCGVRINAVVIKFSELNTRRDAIKHIFKTGYPVTGYIYFYEVLKNV
ncbi:MAG: nucleotidyltransferase domain-containing protein [Nanoarchaeota archaeon]|nr:nucleotidyltransferase domain-containing protein [Nanoarchaeota archaeon]